MPEYKTTFNYLLTHKVIPHFFFTNLEFFYENIITNPDNMQLFMQNCMNAALDITGKNPDIEPGEPVESFSMRIFGEIAAESVISVLIPNCKRECDSIIVVFPCMREHARYFTCELSSNPLDGEKFFIMGEWEQEGDDYKHINYGRVDASTTDSFPNSVIGLLFGDEDHEFYDGSSDDDEDEDAEKDPYDETIQIAGTAWAYYEHGLFEEALYLYNRVMEDIDNSAEFFHCRSLVHKAMGNLNAADYDLFRAKLIDMIDIANGEEVTGETEKELGLEQRKPLFYVEGFYDILQNKEGDLLFCIRTREGEERMAELLYSGGKNALLRRRIDQYILLDEVHPDVKETLSKIDEILVAEFDPGDVEEPKYNVESGIIKEYTVPVRHFHENVNLDSIDEIREDGYPLFLFLGTLARENYDKQITEVIPKEELPNLAGILAREEEYGLLEKYVKGGLPLNERLGWWFKNWEPTPLFYITGYKIIPAMKDTEIMLHYLTERGADPNLTSIEGDTPLGNQCLAKGTVNIMKALLDCGADPNTDTAIDEVTYKPLTLQLCPSEYDQEKHTFTPLTALEADKAALLIEAGADVNAEMRMGMTSLALVLTFSAGAERAKLVSLLINKGADIDAAVQDMQNFADEGYPEYSYALYELFAGFPNQKEPMPEVLSKWRNKETADKYLKQSAEEGYNPAKNPPA